MVKQAHYLASTQTLFPYVSLNKASSELVDIENQLVKLKQHQLYAILQGVAVEGRSIAPAI